MESMRLKIISKILSARNENEGLTSFKDILYNKFLNFANKVSSLANEAEMVLKLQDIERDLELISAYPNLYKKNVIAVGGGFSAGKSEFISSFIKNDIKLPIGVVPTTAIPSYVINEEENIFLGCTNKGGVVKLNEIDKEFYKKLSHDFIKSFEFNLKDIMPYMIIGTKTDYKNICFIDTPGYNPASISDGFTSEDIKTAKSFLEDVDTLIWLIGADANGTISQSDLEFLENLDLENKTLYVVYNKADLKSPDDIEDILDSIEENLEDNDINYAGISAYSSIMKEEYSYKKISLKEFLENVDVIKSKQSDILKKLKIVYDAYKNAIEKDIKEKETIYKKLHSLSLDIYEDGLVKIDNEVFDTIDELKKFFKTDKEKDFLKELKEVFEEFKKSVVMIFNREIEFDFDDKLKVEKISFVDKTKLHPLKKDGLYGFFNFKEGWVIKPQFDYAYDFKNGLAKVEKDGKWGAINEKGKFILLPLFNEVEILDDVIRVEFGKNGGLVSLDGEYLTFSEEDLK